MSASNGQAKKPREKRAFWLILGLFLPVFSVFRAIFRVLCQKLTRLFLFIRYLNSQWKPGSNKWSFAGVKRILRQDIAFGKVEKISAGAFGGNFTTPTVTHKGCHPTLLTPSQHLFQRNSEEHLKFKQKKAGSLAPKETEAIKGVQDGALSKVELDFA